MSGVSWPGPGFMDMANLTSSPFPEFKFAGSETRLGDPSIVISSLPPPSAVSNRESGYNATKTLKGPKPYFTRRKTTRRPHYRPKTTTRYTTTPSTTTTMRSKNKATHQIPSATKSILGMLIFLWACLASINSTLFGITRDF